MTTRIFIVSIGSMLIACMLLTGYVFYHHTYVEMPRAYQAWVKLTGNKKNLSYEEWRSLFRTTAVRRSTPY